MIQMVLANTACGVGIGALNLHLYLLVSLCRCNASLRGGGYRGWSIYVSVCLGTRICV